MSSVKVPRILAIDRYVEVLGEVPSEFEGDYA
jgi:hypothetical protein